MGRLSASILALLLGATATVALASCGGSGDSGLLPGSTASEINANLDKVQELVSAGDCVGAEDASAAVSGQIEELGGVNSRLKEALSEGAARLSEVVATCEELPEEDEELEELQAAEEAGEAEEEAAEKKEKAEKPDKSDKEAGVEKEQKEPPVEPPEPPAGEEKEAPSATEEGGGTPSGGVGPAAPVGGE